MCYSCFVEVRRDPCFYSFFHSDSSFQAAEMNLRPSRAKSSNLVYMDAYVRDTSPGRSLGASTISPVITVPGISQVESVSYNTDYH